MKKFPEAIILAVVLGLLALGVAALAFTFPTVEDITNVTSTEPDNPNRLQPLKEADLEASVAALNTPALWATPASNHRLFISKDFLFYPSLYPSGNYLQANDGTARSPRGVLLSWYQKYGLDFTKPGIDLEDTDGDGFANVVEFKNEKPGERLKAEDCDGSKSSNPLDPQSHPDYLARLRLEKYESRSFHITFRGYQVLNGETLFQIFLSDIPSYNQPRLKKTGDQLGFEGYVIGDFHQSIVTKVDPGTKTPMQVDVSTLDLIKPDIGYKVTLPYRQDVDSPESTADFAMLMPSEVGKSIKASRGKVFAIPYLTDRKFRLIDVKDTGAVIRDTQSNQDTTILKLDPADWDEVPQPKSP